ncbi:MAG: TIGR01459 family HAD-type hydrolase [Proteobacteria bacterium]|nr:TIGR01459 family HAD-type hydrolase [Pseudomonadota bacterium]
MSASPQLISGLSEVFGSYEGFILDLWGVVHDGAAPFPDTIPALQLLKKAKRKVWLLSNAPRRAHIVAQRLTEMGVATELYDGVLTSGEMTWQALHDTLLTKWGRRCLHIGRVQDASLYEGLDVELVQDPADADFVLNSGVMDFSDPAEKYLPVLKRCSEHGLPMLCANPDKTVHIENKLVICAGTLADLYATLEGEVVYFGKPYRSVYSRCLQELGSGRVLAVGDSMLTDIAGATGAGLDSVLVTSGIHREEFAKNDWRNFLARYPYQPSYVMKSFSW